MSKSVYEMVTDRIIEQLENGVIPWLKPWHGANKWSIQQNHKETLFLIKSDVIKTYW